MEKRPLFAGWIRRPPAPSRVPAGQMYLQKAGRGRPFFRPYRRGTRRTRTRRIRYLRPDRILVALLFLILGVGILCSSSWTMPKGQSHPQTVRPRSSPQSIRIPRT